MAMKRIQYDAAIMSTNPPPNCKASPHNDNLLFWRGSIKGPSNSPYSGGVFNLTIEFTEEYPFVPPKIKFETRVYHPNINIKNGEICLDILKEQWLPTLTIQNVLLSIYSLLIDPNPDDPFNTEAANLYKINKSEYDKYVKDYTFKYAIQ